MAKSSKAKKISTGTWNYRVMAHEHNGEVYFQVHSVYYKSGKAMAYSVEPDTVGGSSISEIKKDLARMAAAARKPILWYGEKWPAVYKPSKKKK